MHQVHAKPTQATIIKQVKQETIQIKAGDNNISIQGKIAYLTVILAFIAIMFYIFNKYGHHLKKVKYIFKRKKKNQNS